MKRKLFSFLPYIGSYLLATGLAFWGFSRLAPVSSVALPLAQKSAQKAAAGQFSGPRDRPCPLNGEFFTRDQEKIWQKRRPLLVMIENHRQARPQSGLSRADIVYEAVAEGGITRFMGVYYCRATVPTTRSYDVGPVRSARTYFLDWASEYSAYPLYNHVGGANCSAPSGARCTSDPRAQALEQIDQYGWLSPKHHSDMNQFALDYHQCRREPERDGRQRATEHTMYCSTKALWNLADKRNLSGWDKDYFQAWKFKDDQKATAPAAKTISFYFWPGYDAYRVSWRYDLAKNDYQRSNGGQPHIDLLTNKQLTAKVVILQFVKQIGPVDSHKHMLYGTIGRGKAVILQDGRIIRGSWKKTKRQTRTVFYNQRGEEMKFNRGQIWIEALPIGTKVSYES